MVGAGEPQAQPPVPHQVSQLDVSTAFTLPESTTVRDAAKLMAKEKVDALLVTDQHDAGSLVGIVTDKDLAFRVVAEGRPANLTRLHEVMTREPTCVLSCTSATEALAIMAENRFRHLPVLDNSGEVFGMMDITRCLYHAMNRMERAYASSRKLLEGFEDVQRDWGTSMFSAKDAAAAAALRERMCCPEVRTVLDHHSAPPFCSTKTSVRDAMVILRDAKATGLLVLNESPSGKVRAPSSHPDAAPVPETRLAGIFTTKDMVLRVLADSADPDTTTIVRVITPKPEVIAPGVTVLEALHHMHKRHFSHLPVVEAYETGERHLIGMVDVLRLTYSALGEISAMESGFAPSAPGV